MASRKCSMVKDIDDSTDMWRIVVRVLRRWNSYQKGSSTQLYAICFLLVDQEGSKIQASILNKFLFKQYEKYPVEDHSYFIANFEVIHNGKDYKPANHKYKLLFNAATYVKEQAAPISLSVFSFFPIADILNQTVQNHTMYLFDLIAFVTSVGPLEEYHSASEVKTKIRLILSDERENTIEMVLFDECALSFCAHDFNVMQKPIVLVAQLARVGFDDNGQPEVCSSYHATKIYLNPNFEEVKQFIASAHTLPSPTISLLSQSVESQRSNSAVQSIMRNTPRIKVIDIPNQEVDKYFTVLCEFKKFETRHGWIYDGCSRCGTKPRVQNGSASCGSNFCKGKPCIIQSKLRLNYLISDNSGTASIVFFDKLASELMKKSAAELKADIPKDEIQYEFPTEINSLLGKKMILRMKLNKYNKEHPNSSVSVATYAECADLIDEFNDAASEAVNPILLDNDDEEDFVFMTNPTIEESQPADPNASISLCETSPSMDMADRSAVDVMHVTTSKGKRKVPSKKPPASSSKVVEFGPQSPSKSPIKPLKSIKQEKN